MCARKFTSVQCVHLYIFDMSGSLLITVSSIHSFNKYSNNNFQTVTCIFHFTQVVHVLYIEQVEEGGELYGAHGSLLCQKQSIFLQISKHQKNELEY